MGSYKETLKLLFCEYNQRQLKKFLKFFHLIFLSSDFVNFWNYQKLELLVSNFNFVIIFFDFLNHFQKKFIFFDHFCGKDLK